MFFSKLKVCVSLSLALGLIAVGLAVIPLGVLASLESASTAPQTATPNPVIQQVPAAGNQTKNKDEKTQPAVVQGQDLVKVGDRLRIRVVTGFPNAGMDFDDVVVVEVSGKISVGPGYGRVHINSLALEDAEIRVKEHFVKFGAPYGVSLTRHDPLPQTAGVGKLERLEMRVQQLETEVQTLRNAVDKLKK